MWVVAAKLYKVNNTPTSKQKIFSTITTPETSVLAAIRASTAVPYFFSRIRLKKLEKGKYVVDDSGDIYDDGGLLNNYPIDVFDKPEFMDLPSDKNITMVNPHTLGFVLLNNNQIYDSQRKPAKDPIKDGKPIEFIKSIFNTITQAANNKNLTKDNRNRTIQIDRQKVKLEDFDIDEKKKEMLIQGGKKAVNDYFTNHFYADKPVIFGRFWNSVTKKTGCIQ